MIFCVFFPYLFLWPIVKSDHFNLSTILIGIYNLAPAIKIFYIPLMSILKSAKEAPYELSVKFASEICHENTNKLVDGTYLADFGIDIKWWLTNGMQLHTVP